MFLHYTLSLDDCATKLITVVMVALVIGDYRKVTSVSIGRPSIDGPRTYLSGE